MKQVPRSTSPYWDPLPIWKGEQVFLIGGGPSLKEMDWAPLFLKRNIGLNDAYLLGEWVDMCFWTDSPWLEAHRKCLKMFKGYKITAQSTRPMGLPGVLWVDRRPKGLFPSHRIAWNWSTGAAAINLALLLGAVQIVLLGYDMKKGPKGEKNWHPNNVSSGETPFNRFREGFQCVVEKLHQMFPGVEVLNAGPDSALECFCKVQLKDVL